MLTAARSFSLSACVLLAALAFAGPGDLLKKVKQANTEEEFTKLQSELDKTLGDKWRLPDSNLSQSLPDGTVVSQEDWTTVQARAETKLENLDRQEQAAQGKVDDPKAEATKILASPEYHDNGVSTEKNWLSQTFERAGRFISEWLNNLFKKLFPENQSAAMPASGFGRMNFAPVVWGILILGLGAFAFYAVTKFRWSFSRRVRAGGLLAEDEPDRTADEWISRSDELSANKQYREAVRCLYLACLVKFDEANVMRFRRGETNWEHFHRFSDSPRRPEGLDLKWATSDFDVIWYGHRTKGQSDVDRFREFYNQVVEATRRVKAAA